MSLDGLDPPGEQLELPLTPPPDPVRLAIADPPYLGRSEMFYGERNVANMNAGGNVDPVHKADAHPDAALWDQPETHRALVASLCEEFDGWAIAMHPDNLYEYLQWVPRRTRIAVWHDPNVMPTGAHPRRRWEAVLVYVPNGRRRVRDIPGPHVSDVLVATRRGSGGSRPGKSFVGAKPPAWVHWVLAMLGHRDTDVVVDLFPGSGAVSAALGQPGLNLWPEKP